MVTHSQSHRGAVHPEQWLAALEGARPGEQRREIGAVEMDALGFVDVEESADRGKQIDGSGRLVLDAAARDLVFPIEDSRDAVAAFEV